MARESESTRRASLRVGRLLRCCGRAAHLVVFAATAAFLLSLQMLQRQSLINQLYSSGESIIEKTSSSHLPASSFTLKSSASYPVAFQDWLRAAQIGTNEPEPAAIKAETAPASHRYDEQKTPTLSGPMPEN